MPGPATLSDLTARSFRPLTPQEQSVATVLLEDAWDLIVSSVADASDKVAADAAYSGLVVQVQCAMVLRVVKNPDGLLSEQIDDYEYRRDSALSTGALYLSGDERALLASGAGQSDGAWSIRARAPYGRGYWASTDLWVPL